MKMRLRPLRGQTYKTEMYGPVKFLEMLGTDGLCRVIVDDKIRAVTVDHLALPIIDTKDYEKIEDTKYKGD